jgi:hypothetical protein
MRCLTITFLFALLAVGPRAQTPPTWPLPAVLARAATYVEAYAGRFVGMVVEEFYVQDVITMNRFGYRVNMSRGPIHRTLKSDLLLVRPEGTDVWMQFRDVFEVDGKPVRDRNDRLQKLFLQPSKSSSAQADKIVRESVRYNIGDVERTINLPVLGMTILDRRVQTGFQFQMGGSEDPGHTLPQSQVFIPPADAVVISFTETQIRSLITNPQGKNLKSHGRFWVRMPDAQVLMTELLVDDFTLGAAVHVAYQPRPGFELPVPVEMHETYLNRLNNSRVEGSATYSNYRQFNVRTAEAIAAPPLDP